MKKPEMKSIQRMGGLARAKVLSPVERSAISKKAATARWNRVKMGPQKEKKVWRPGFDPLTFGH